MTVLIKIGIKQYLGVCGLSMDTKTFLKAGQQWKRGRRGNDVAKYSCCLLTSRKSDDGREKLESQAVIVGWARYSRKFEWCLRSFWKYDESKAEICLVKVWSFKDQITNRHPERGLSLLIGPTRMEGTVSRVLLSDSYKSWLMHIESTAVKLENRRWRWRRSGFSQVHRDLWSGVTMLASAKISIQQVVFELTEAQIKDETHKLRESVGVYDINIVSVQVC